jgi:hypothetical protein
MSFLIDECSLPQIIFYFQSSAQNSVIEFKTQIIIKFNFQSISYV